MTDSRASVDTWRTRDFSLLTSTPPGQAWSSRIIPGFKDSSIYVNWQMWYGPSTGRRPKKSHDHLSVNAEEVCDKIKCPFKIKPWQSRCRRVIPQHEAMHGKSTASIGLKGDSEVGSTTVWKETRYWFPCLSVKIAPQVLAQRLCKRETKNKNAGRVEIKLSHMYTACLHVGKPEDSLRSSELIMRRITQHEKTAHECARKELKAKDVALWAERSSASQSSWVWSCALHKPGAAVHTSDSRDRDQ